MPYLDWGQLRADQWTLQSHARLQLSLADSDSSSAEFAAIVHWMHTPQPRSVFPAFEVMAEVAFERGMGPEREDAVQWSLLPQARIGLSKRSHLALNAGLELPLNERDRYEGRANFYRILDFAESGFFES